MANPNYRFTRALVAALAELGLEHACITPGSRNSPMALAFAMSSRVKDWVHLDERSAAFFALGMARTTGRPVALVCTSGTAAAEYLPALVEARFGRVPLIALTADRPPELRDVGAPQAVDQVGLYGRTVKWFHEAAVPSADPDPAPYATRLAEQSWAAALHPPTGPVHLNLPFREPLAPVDLGPEPEQPAVAFRPTRLTVDPAVIHEAARLVSGTRALIIAGPADRPSPAILDLAAALDAPVVADPLSGLRASPYRPGGTVVSTGDAVARTGGLDGVLRPDTVIRFGAPPTSKALERWLAGNPATRQVVVDEGEWRVGTTHPTMVVPAPPGDVASRIAEHVAPGPAGWNERWVEADRAIRNAWAELPFPSEPAVAARLASALPDGARLWAASSMPVRDLDSFFPAIDRDLPILANRGANGIDGFLSSALGSAAAGDRPVYALSGDLSLLHDLTALLAGVRLGVDLTVIVVDNDGGGIFHFLPQAEHPEYFESHLVTPHGIELGAVVRALGADHVAPKTPDEFDTTVGEMPSGVKVVTVRTDRVANADLHRTLVSAAADALAGL